MQFFYEKHIDGNIDNAVRIATEAWLEICDNGYGSSHFIGFNGTDSCVYGYDDTNGCIAGIIVYRNDSVSKRAYIQIGWVHADYRGNGVYKQLLAFFEDQLKKDGINLYETIVSPDNDEMKNISDLRSPVGTLYRKIVS